MNQYSTFFQNGSIRITFTVIARIALFELKMSFLLLGVFSMNTVTYKQFLKIKITYKINLPKIHFHYFVPLFLKLFCYTSSSYLLIAYFPEKRNAFILIHVFIFCILQVRPVMNKPLIRVVLIPCRDISGIFTFVISCLLDSMRKINALILQISLK